MMRTHATAAPIIRRLTSFLGVFAVAAAMTSFAGAAAYAAPAAGCSQWNVAGTWHVSQDPGGPYQATFNFALDQNAAAVTGTADYATGGTVTGTMNGNNFAVVVTWNSGGAGEYLATISADGTSLVGHGHQLVGGVAVPPEVTWSATAASPATLSGGGKDLTVPAGATCYLVAGTSVTHDVKVARGGTLFLDGATIGHDLHVDGTLIMTGGTVGHDVHVDGALTLSGGTIGHDLHVHGTWNITPGSYTVGHDTHLHP